MYVRSACVIYVYVHDHVQCISIYIYIYTYVQNVYVFDCYNGAFIKDGHFTNL